MRRGKRVSAQGAQLVFARNNLAVSRFAFVIPKSVDKRAVTRNRTRRILRESVRLLLSTIVPGWDGVFLVRNGSPKAQELLGRAGMLL